MPTGYTSAVQDGTITSLADFAMQCARAFGATITMRDDPMDAPIPERFEPRSYHDAQRKKAHARLARLARMSPTEAQIECQAHNARAIRDWVKACDRRAMHRVRYDAMLDQVLAWTPPTRRHDEFQRFMVEQLESSIKFDCSPGYPDSYPSPLRWPAWLDAEHVKARKDIFYHTQHLLEDIDRASDHSTWVRDLRASLQ